MAATTNDSAALGIAPLEHFTGARKAAGPADRLAEVRVRSRVLHDELMDSDPVAFYKSVGLVRVPYPRSYGFRDAASVPTPLVHILNRLFIVRFRSNEGVKTLLFSPSDYEANAETPFFKNLARTTRIFGRRGRDLIAPALTTVEEAVAAAGIAPEDVDYISYDHLHTQDVRRWLGTNGSPGHFPNAKLLVMRQEWESAQALLPTQKIWYCPDGTAGVDPARVVLLDSGVRLGAGVILMATPGHTEGNHSLVVRTPDGVMVSSENGIGPDAYAPEHSKIPGVAAYARRYGVEVIMNANTLEGAVDQYISMVQEKTVAGPSMAHGLFPNVVCSSEFTHYRLFPGMRPTANFGDLEYGDVNEI